MRVGNWRAWPALFGRTSPSTEPPTPAGLCTAFERPWFVNRNGMPTRYPEPPEHGRTTTTEVLDLTAEQSLHQTALHEAAHAALWTEYGVPLERAWVRTVDEAVRIDGTRAPAGQVVVGSRTSLPLAGAIAVAAAGERADDRWLRETGLWTEERAWVIERHAAYDRAYALNVVTRSGGGDRMTFGERPGHPHDYATAQNDADAHLDQMWDGVHRLADVLIQRRHIDGAEIPRVLNATPE